MILKGKMALVTGGQRDWCRGCKGLLPKEPRSVLPPPGERLEAVVRSLPAGTAVACAGDVSDPSRLNAWSKQRSLWRRH